MQPHAGERLTVRRLRLCDLVLVVRKDEVDSTAVDVERVAEVVLAHRRALDVPAGPAATERRLPRGAQLLVAGLRLLPKGEVADVLLLVFVGRDARAGFQAGSVQVRKRPVFRKARDAEVHVAVRYVSVFALE